MHFYIPKRHYYYIQKFHEHYIKLYGNLRVLLFTRPDSVKVPSSTYNVHAIVTPRVIIALCDMI